MGCSWKAEHRRRSGHEEEAAAAAEEAAVAVVAAAAAAAVVVVVIARLSSQVVKCETKARTITVCRSQGGRLTTRPLKRSTMRAQSAVFTTAL